MQLFWGKYLNLNSHLNFSKLFFSYSTVQNGKSIIFTPWHKHFLWKTMLVNTLYLSLLLLKLLVLQFCDQIMLFVHQFHFWEYIQRNPKLIWKNISTPMSIATAKIWKQPKCPSVDEWIRQLWDIYTMEYYSAVKRKILPFMTVWMDLENIMLSEISQSEKNKYHMISLICGI